MPEDERADHEISGAGMDGSGNLALTIGRAVPRFSRSHRREDARELGKSGSAVGAFGNIGGIGLDAQGRVYVVDRIRKVVMIFDADATHTFLREFGGDPRELGMLVMPSDVVIDGRGRAYVTQVGSGGVSVFQCNERETKRVSKRRQAPSQREARLLRWKAGAHRDPPATGGRGGAATDGRDARCKEPEMRISRYTLLALATVALAIGLGTNAYAFHSGGVAECSGCHSMHSPFPGGTSLLVGSDKSAACLSCHEHAGDTTQSSYHISTASADMPVGTAPLQRTPGGDFGWLKKTYTWPAAARPPDRDRDGASHGHNIIAGASAAGTYNYVVDPDNATAPGGTYPSANLGCTSCHDPHGKARRLADGTIVSTVSPSSDPAPTTQRRCPWPAPRPWAPTASSRAPATRRTA
jgi:hypothetical protein